MDYILRDNLVIEITKILLNEGLKKQSTPPFSIFLNANPLLLANAIVNGQKMDRCDLREIYQCPEIDPVNSSNFGIELESYKDNSCREYLREKFDSI